MCGAHAASVLCFDPAFLQDLTELLLRRNPLLLADDDEHGLVPYVRGGCCCCFARRRRAVQWALRCGPCVPSCVDSRQAASLWWENERTTSM
jgi:hypothetical protein